MKYCNSCNLQYDDNQNFCNQCGSSLTVGVTPTPGTNLNVQPQEQAPPVKLYGNICPQCSNKLQDEYIFCDNCGWDMVNNLPNVGRLDLRQMSTWEKIKSGGNVFYILFLLALNALVLVLLIGTHLSKL